MRRKVTKKMIRESILTMFNMGIEITEPQILFLLLNNKSLRDDWDAVGDVDTAFKDALLDAIAKDCKVKSCDGCWPTGLTHKETKKQFEIEFKEKAHKKGYILNKDFGV